MDQEFDFNLADTTDEEVVRQRLKNKYAQTKNIMFAEACAIIYKNQPISRHNITMLLGKIYGRSNHENTFNSKLRQLECCGIIFSDTYADSLSSNEEEHMRIRKYHEEDYSKARVNSLKLTNTKYFSMTKRGKAIMPFILEKMKEVIVNEKKSQQS